MKPYLIIVCGLPCTGKTTLANELSKKLGIFCLHKDTVKKSLYESMGMNSLEYSIKIGYPSVKTIMELAKENLARGISVIIESPFNFPDEGKRFSDWKKKYNLSVFSVIMQLNEDERKKRFLRRERDKSHHDNERKISSDINRTSYQHMPEKRIFITSDKSIAELAQIVVDEIGV